VSVCVVGSINLDRVLRVPRIPAPGETLLGDAVRTFAGGKGDNQAVAVARSGAPVVLIAALGRDGDAEALLTNLERMDVEQRIRRVDRPTGTAWITVGDDGENTIVVVPGANEALLEPTEEELSVVRAARVVLLQQEIPAATVAAVAAAGFAAGATVVLNAAPSRPADAVPWASVSVLVVNEHEAADLVGEAAEAGDATATATALLALVPAVVVTLGGNGAVVAVRGADPVHLAARPVAVTDTTGAGDAFCGALAAELDRTGSPTIEALVGAARYATDVAALAVQREGAQAGIPTRAEVEAVFG
jgi:ribokinase